MIHPAFRTAPDNRFTVNHGFAGRLSLAYVCHGMKLIIALLIGAMALGSVSAAEEDSSEEIHNTSVVDSGTYQVTAKKVDAEEKEIYVTTADGKTLELYFSDATKLTRGGQTVGFDALQNGQKLEVQVEKSGSKLKPLSVVILD